ncbi:hypothetical protein [Pinibacter aurantiacus]|uniref:Uncharacterized protein n=1 Tax=Pinibacter aurantiacus TaxID=2851599 RepID=A0A9E2W6Y5_9BACT|nr:hypothetical protein [Pinibacter aurantiacus]MBV4355816.1 hypothetical protein [Pinibacter aurantiacus]
MSATPSRCWRRHAAPPSQQGVSVPGIHAVTATARTRNRWHGYALAQAMLHIRANDWV